MTQLTQQNHWPLLLGICLAASPLSAQSATTSMLVDELLSAPDRQAARAVSIGLVAAAPPFSDLYRLLKAGRTFSTDVPVGRVLGSRRNDDGTEHHHFLLVPDDYDPTHRHPVRVYLHGGVGRGPWDPDGSWWRRYERVTRPDEIAVFPSSWNESLWWEGSQVENISAILDQLKRRYNIDENRVHMFGISDGGTGAYFYAFKTPIPWAGFFIFIAHPAVLNNPRLRVDGEMFPLNLTNRPLYVVNGDVDRLYPAASVLPFVDLFQAFGVEVDFRPKDGGHNVEWWPEEAPHINAFIESHPRDPLPDRVAWQTERTDRYNRMAWLVIDELGAVPGEQPAVAFPRDDLFPHPRPSGRVLLERQGNTVTAATRGVKQFTLLLSPEEFDLTQPIRVVVNGSDAFDDIVSPSVETLLEWFAQDNDRTMLFGAEVTVVVPSN